MTTYDDSWAIDYIDDTVRLNPKHPPTSIFSALPGPSYNDTVSIQEAPQYNSDMDNIHRITDPDIEIPENAMTILSYMNHITGYIHKAFKDISKNPEDISSIVQQQLDRNLLALIRFTGTMCNKLEQVPHLHYVWNSSSTAADAKLVRSSYKFCENSASCKDVKCSQHHYVYNRLYGDLMSLQLYTSNHKGSWNIAEVVCSINTAYYVVSHMHHEHHSRQTMGVYNKIISNTQNLQTVESLDILIAKEDGWKEVTHTRRTCGRKC
jgi:hypothetical protein